MMFSVGMAFSLWRGCLGFVCLYDRCMIWELGLAIGSDPVFNFLWFLAMVFVAEELTQELDQWLRSSGLPKLANARAVIAP